LRDDLPLLLQARYSRNSAVAAIINAIAAKKNLKMNRRKKQFAGALATAAGVLISTNNPAASQTLNQFIGFGDSTIDSGYYRTLPSPGGGAIYNSYWAAAVAAGAGARTTPPVP
jgi:hypothetical protein